MGIGVFLIEQGLIDQRQLDAAVEEQRTTGDRLDRVLVRQGAVSQADVLQVLGEHLALPIVDILNAAIPDEVLSALPAQLICRQLCVPIEQDAQSITVATSDPFAIGALDELRMLAGREVELALADEDDLRVFIRDRFGVAGDTLDQLEQDRDDTSDAALATAPEDDLDQAEQASVIRLVNDLLSEAITERATDVHIEPYEHELAVRYRIDGVLQKAAVPPTIHRYGNAIVSRLKIMANLDIAEKRRPQDGRITFTHRGSGRREECDLRVSVIPMLFGEGVVLRVLSKTAALMPLEELGMPTQVLDRWDRVIARPHGIILVTGPTGSGKSTTLYASLNRVVSDAVKAITIEDPVEYHVAGVNQIQVNLKTQLTFAAGLRSVLRHDPDVVMVGEIRDRETAEVAIQASLTGHLVFSTLHTNDSAGAVTRLLDMGVEPFLVSSSLEAVLAQRLVRRICPVSNETYTPDPADLPPDFELPKSGKLVRGVPSRDNRHTGYRGRVGVYELFSLDDTAREQIMKHANTGEIAQTARDRGALLPMQADAYEKVRAGVTTVQEVARVLAG